MATQRLYYDDACLVGFHARIVDRGCDPCEIYLDRTAFYPTSGGQPYDTGTIAGVPVIDVVDQEDRILHRVARPVNQHEAECRIDWPRRFDHMQQHSGQHLLSAVFAEVCGAPTISFHLGSEASTIDLDVPSLTPDQIRTVEARANEVVFENRPISVSYEDAAGAAGLRKPSERAGPLRIVTIRDLDRSACGGTHVGATGEIGPIFLRKTEKIRGSIRAEFLCGGRAVRRARADADALEACARVFSCAPDEAPALVGAAQAKLVETEKARARLARELAQIRGRALYHDTAPDASGVRCLVRRIAVGPISEDLRAEAQSFTSLPKAVFVALVEDPPSALLAASEDSGVHAGNSLKQALNAVRGRGGGNAQLAQGSVPSKEALLALADLLAAVLPR